ncbi:vitamin K epoxide reductase family protein [Saccharicrinis sp. FJH54]|uniref:vitamin K epoxide reductase family protein n=1 Tax=Saccharicrinis sp. FJH54 TaxID=3344665 RepID=UPI0035D47DC0
MIQYSQDKNNWPFWRLLFTGLNVLAIGLSLVLSWDYFTEGAMPGCGSGSSCDQVLSSRWSTLAGLIPVSGMALGVYLAILVAGLNISNSVELSVRRLSWSVMTFLGGVIIGSAIWFTVLQKWIIGSFCMYCMTTHFTGVLLSALIIRRAFKAYETTKKEKQLLKPKRIIVLILTGLIVSGLMAVYQFRYTPSADVHESNTQEYTLKTDYRNVPIIGSPDAPYIVTLLFDYQCSHCQKLHFMLDEAVRQYNGKLAFILRPTPLEHSCNPFIPVSTTNFKNSCELAKIGLAVWRANPEAFSTFENWMFTFDSGNYWRPRTLEAVKSKAAELVGTEKLETALADPWIERYLQSSVQLFGQTLQNGRGAIPKLIYDSKWIIPEPYNADELVSILQESLGIPKK